MKFHIRYSFTLLTFLFISSCSKFVTVPPPDTQVVNETAFSTDASAISTVVGLYSKIMNTPSSMLNGGSSFIGGLSSDEFSSSFADPYYDPFYNNALQASQANVNDIWIFGYNIIFQANACIDGLQRSSTLTPSLRQELSGEAKCIRALAYFYLVNYYGNVPYENSTDYELNSRLPRSSDSLVYDSIRVDLKTAQVQLSSVSQSGTASRPNSYTATALLARVNLFEKNWADAISNATIVINSGLYSLEPDLNHVYWAGSMEAIWQFAPVKPVGQTSEGLNFIPSGFASVKPEFILSPYLLNAFDSGDLRKQDWINAKTVNGTAYYYPYKYKNKYVGSPIECNMVIRLAELYLIRAESEAELNDPLDAVADLNVIRNRAGLPEYLGPTDKQSLLTAIYHEKQVEFFAEWGHRWLDLKRTGTADAILETEKPNWNTNAQWFPIPLTQIQLNNTLTQNVGY